MISTSLYRAVLTAFALFSGALCFIPLFNVLGYEYAVSIAVIIWLAGGVFIAAAARTGKRRLGPVSTGEIFRAATLLLIVPLLISSANAIRVTNCSWTGGLFFYLLIPCVTGLLLAAFTGMAVSLKAPPWLTIAVWYLAGAVEIAARVLEIYRGPQTFFYSHIIGYFPGPLYDEALRAGWPLAAFRAGSVLAAAMFITVSRAADRRMGVPSSAAVVFSCVMGFALLHAEGEGLGFASGRTFLEHELEGVHRTGRFTIRYQRDQSIKKDIVALAAMHEFHLSEIEREIGTKFQGRITSYVFKGPADKKALLGSGPTNIAKPWLKEIYVNQEQFPYHTLRHEIAHVVMGAFPSNSLGIPGRLGGLLPNMGLVEGAAVALEFEGPDATHHQIARVMLDHSLLPEMEQVLTTKGFYGISAGRAYSAAGSLMRWLLETEGPRKFVEAYAGGDLEKTYGRSPTEIVGSWKKFLSSVPLEGVASKFWASQLGRPAIFGIKCAHEAAYARMKAGNDASKGKPGAALEELRLLCRSACQNTERKTIAELEAKTGDAARGIVDMEALLAVVNLEERVRADALDWLGMAEWERGDIERARRWFEKLAAMELDSARRRTADLRLSAVVEGDPRLRELLRRFNAEDSDPSVRPVVLERAIRDFSAYWPAAYLLGRHLFNRSEYEAAVYYLEMAADRWPDRAGMATDTVGRENLRLLGICRAVAGRRDDAENAFKVAAEGGTPAWRAHIEFLRRTAAGAGFAEGR